MYKKYTVDYCNMIERITVFGILKRDDRRLIAR